MTIDRSNHHMILGNMNEGREKSSLKRASSWLSRSLMVSSLLSAAMIGACANISQGDRYAGTGIDYYDGYYDGFYGPFYDGYWGNDGNFWYRDHNGAWGHDGQNHFHHAGGAGFGHVHGSGVARAH